MGEAHHLTPEERLELIRAARTALNIAGFHDTPIIAGTGRGRPSDLPRMPLWLGLIIPLSYPVATLPPHLIEWPLSSSSMMWPRQVSFL